MHNNTAWNIHLCDHELLFCLSPVIFFQITQLLFHVLQACCCTLISIIRQEGLKFIAKCIGSFCLFLSTFLISFNELFLILWCLTVALDFSKMISTSLTIKLKFHGFCKVMMTQNGMMIMATIKPVCFKK